MVTPVYCKCLKLLDDATQIAEVRSAALKHLVDISRDGQIREMMEDLEKQKRIQHDKESFAKAQGIQKGREEGLKTAIKSVAKKMLRLGIDDQTIIKSTGISSVELEQLKNQ